jgi:Cu(I)/Ag(I) efflux system membrane protein CusA/SilA
MRLAWYWCRRREESRRIPLGELATLKLVNGPGMLRDEGGLLTGYVYVDVSDRDPGSYVEEAARMVRDRIALPPGYAVLWSGQYGRWSVSVSG